MNPKIKKISDELDKTIDKIADLQSRKSELEKQKLELENLEIIGMVRAMEIPLEDFAELAKTLKKNRPSLEPKEQKENENE